jgi:hypothetical protein
LYRRLHSFLPRIQDWYGHCQTTLSEAE